jgi:hypothetical protein
MVPVQAQPIAQSPWGQSEYNEGHSTPGFRVNLIPSAGDQNIMIPELWPSRQFDPSVVWIKPLDPQGSGIKTGRRDNLVPQYWGSNHSDPEALAFASIRGSIHYIHKVMGSKMAFAPISSHNCWESHNSDPAAVAFASFGSPNCGDQTISFTSSLDQKWPSRQYDPPMLGTKPF